MRGNVADRLQTENSPKTFYCLGAAYDYVLIFTQVGRDSTTKILHKINLLKRLESSVYAFDKTLVKMYDRRVLPVLS